MANGKPNSLITRWEAEYLNLSVSKPAIAAEMLRALQSLMSANRSTDERNRLLHAAKREEFDLRTQSRGSDYAHEVVDLICDSLPSTGRESLDSLAETSVLLGLMPVITSQSTVGHEIGTAIIQSTVDTQLVSDQLMALSTLRIDLEGNVKTARKQLQDINSEKMMESASAEGMQAQTAQWSREMKQVSVKIQEYKDRIEALERARHVGSGIDSIKIADVLEMQERVRHRKEIVEELERRVRTFHGLPPDLMASRQEVRRARLQLDQLKRRREEMFEHMTRD